MTNEHSTKALIVVTSVATFPASAGEQAGRQTGFYMDEMAGPYWALRDVGLDVEIASIEGGEPPIDPTSIGQEGERKPTVQRFLDDDEAMAALNTTTPVAALDPTRYAVVFLPGGHGTMFDFRQSAALARVVGKAWDAGSVVGAVCHGPAGLIEAVDAAGNAIVKGRRVNAFTDAEEEAVGLTETMPYLLETALRDKGALFEGTANFQSYAVRDDRLVTGQNPTSVPVVAALLADAVRETRLKPLADSA